MKGISKLVEQPHVAILLRILPVGLPSPIHQWMKNNPSLISPETLLHPQSNTPFREATMAQIPDSADFASFLDLELDLAFYNADEHQKAQQQQMQDAQHQLQNVSLPDHTDVSDHQNAVFDFSMPMDMQFDMGQQHHQLQSHIPQTPNSVEMHPDTAAHYLHQLEAQRALLHQYQMKQTQVLINKKI